MTAENEKRDLLTKAKQGDINAFQTLFDDFYDKLKSYLYRLTANRNDAEDITHDTFVRCFDKLDQFDGGSSLKTWAFRVATNLAYNELKRRKRWTVDVMARSKEIVMDHIEAAETIVKMNQTSTEAQYDVKEHIDTCFTCMSKTLPIENQIALILRDVYDFSVAEIALILDKSAGVVKYLLQNGRKTMTDIFDQRCALINKDGVCYQCSELNGWLNPKQDQQATLMALDLVKGSKKYDRDALYIMRAALIKEIDPLHASGHDLQETLMKCNRVAMDEIPMSGLVNG